MKRNTFLRVKLKSLTAEAKIIQHEEKKANSFKDYSLQNELSEHRKGIVRRETRATILAYQYLRGLPYSVCESPNPNKDNPVDWSSVERMIKKYGGFTKHARAFDYTEWIKS